MVTLVMVAIVLLALINVRNMEAVSKQVMGVTSVRAIQATVVLRARRDPAQPCLSLRAALDMVSVIRRRLCVLATLVLMVLIVMRKHVLRITKATHVLDMVLVMRVDSACVKIDGHHQTVECQRVLTCAADVEHALLLRPVTVTLVSRVRTVQKGNVQTLAVEMEIVMKRLLLVHVTRVLTSGWVTTAHLSVTVRVQSMESVWHLPRQL